MKKFLFFSALLSPFFVSSQTKFRPFETDKMIIQNTPNGSIREFRRDVTKSWWNSLIKELKPEIVFDFVGKDLCMEKIEFIIFKINGKYIGVFNYQNMPYFIYDIKNIDNTNDYLCIFFPDVFSDEEIHYRENKNIYFANLKQNLNSSEVNILTTEEFERVLRL